ncbi:hypothetical protein NPIL_407201 [Nephila pilipes]|uniref:Uncharacterized protein n=1 Tax=Nephila pilipes TaxID=299642 RepID=A0A8X6PXZ0_NEPPI|nr:hypothetical protein NPIL_407201 [Nephila pilipes]
MIASRHPPASNRFANNINSFLDGSRNPAVLLRAHGWCCLCRVMSSYPDTESSRLVELIRTRGGSGLLNIRK